MKKNPKMSVKDATRKHVESVSPARGRMGINLVTKAAVALSNGRKEFTTKNKLGKTSAKGAKQAGQKKKVEPSKTFTPPPQIDPKDIGPKLNADGLEKEVEFEKPVKAK